MHDEQHLTFLARWKRQRRSEPRAQEPADLGTAYGLELMLDQASATDAQARGQLPANTGWLARWRRLARKASA